MARSKEPGKVSVMTLLLVMLKPLLSECWIDV